MGQNPDVTIRIQRIERKLYPNITILSIQSQIFPSLFEHRQSPQERMSVNIDQRWEK